MMKVIKARLKELQTARDAFVANANATVRDYDVAIAELEQLLKPASNQSESHAE
jgi:hypothetical protein